MGVAKEFPTALRDSFLLANATYIARMTGSDSIGAFLVDTGGRSISSVAAELRDRVGSTASVSDLTTTRQIVGSSLTAIDLGGLTTVELGFALALAAGSTGLTAWALSQMLVTVLTRVFDPAPASLAVPWPYLSAVLVISVLATAAVALEAIHGARTPRADLLRALGAPTPSPRRAAPP